MKQRNYPRIIQWDLRSIKTVIRLIVFVVHRRGTDIFLQCLDHSRIIMSENIKL